MSDPRLKNLAEILANYSVAVKPGDWGMVRGNVIAMPFGQRSSAGRAASGWPPKRLFGQRRPQRDHSQRIEQ